MGDSGDTIATIIFQRSRTQQLVAEIAFGPAIAFAVDQTSPSGLQGAILTWAMAGLITIPILRYLVFTDQIERFDKLLDWTVRPVELFALLGVVQVLKFLAVTFFQPFVTLSVVQATAVVTVLVTLLYIIGFELLFKKYRFSWGALFYAKRLALEQDIDIKMDDVEEVSDAIFNEGTTRTRLKAAFGLLSLAIIRVTYGQVAFHLLKNSIPDRGDDAIEELRSYVKMNQKSDSRTDSTGLWFVFSISAIIIIPVLALIAGLISLVAATFGTILLVMLIMRLAKHVVALTYIAFGTMSYEQFITTNRRWVVMMTGYTLTVYLLIFYPI